MLGVILAGGEGTRFAEAGCCKPLLQLNGRFLIEYALENLAKLHVTEALIVVGRYEKQIRGAVGSRYHGVPIRYIRQKKPMGLMNALYCAVRAIGDETVVLQLSDEVFLSPDLSAVEKTSGADFICGFTVPDDPLQICENYAVICRDNVVLHTEEKPAVPLGEKKGTGFCIFNGDCIAYLRGVYAPDQEKWDLCDFMNDLIRAGKAGLAVRIADAEINVNHPDKLSLAKQLLEQNDE